ncbi:hypothetical protein [Aquimarina macrocephali]|uniref:hypothetical protein n=1 Tax=Aquimarina macrocephali TaxID=666563 RepID=UPI0004664582|nr:hypothetical protein [Aquimarina macrocephali]
MNPFATQYDLYASETDYNPFLHHMVRRHLRKRKKRKRNRRRALSMAPRKRSQTIGLPFGGRRGRNRARPVERRFVKPVKRHVPPFSMTIPRQKPHWGSTVRNKPMRRTDHQGRNSVAKPYPILQPLVSKKGTLSKVEEPKRKKLKMITRNFPASRSAANPGISSGRNAKYQPVGIGNQQEAISSTKEATEKKEQGKKDKATMLKIGVTAVVALAAVWFFTSRIANTKQKSYGHTR